MWHAAAFDREEAPLWLVGAGEPLVLRRLECFSSIFSWTVVPANRL
jgi:hypothetical protein